MTVRPNVGLCGVRRARELSTVATLRVEALEKSHCSEIKKTPTLNMQPSVGCAMALRANTS